MRCSYHGASLCFFFVRVCFLNLTLWHEKCAKHNNWAATRGMTIAIFIWGSAKDSMCIMFG